MHVAANLEIYIFSEVTCTQQQSQVLPFLQPLCCTAYGPQLMTRKVSTECTQALIQPLRIELKYGLSCLHLRGDTGYQNPQLFRPGGIESRIRILESHEYPDNPGQVIL